MVSVTLAPVVAWAGNAPSLPMLAWINRDVIKAAWENKPPLEWLALDRRSGLAGQARAGVRKMVDMSSMPMFV